MNKNKAFLVIGGMGPEASGYMYNMLIRLAIEAFGANNNDDFPEVILHSIPVPDFISNNKNRKKALEMLKQRVVLVKDCNVSCISIACNTAHILLPALQAVSKVPFVSMIEEVVKKVEIDGKKIVGLMGTPSTIQYGLYQTALSKYGISVLVPSRRQLTVLEKIIRNVLAGKILERDTKKLKEIGDSFIAKGSEAIILGCTELPLVFPRRYSLPVYNCVEILAMALLQKYYANKKIIP